MELAFDYSTEFADQPNKKRGPNIHMLPKWPWAPDSQLGHKCPQKNSCFFFFTFDGLATHLFHSLFSLLALCSLLYCVFLCVCVCLFLCQKAVCICMPSASVSYTHTHACTHILTSILSPPTPPPPKEYLDPAAGASGDTKDTTVPRSGPSSPPELILHSQSPQQSLVPPPPT